MTTDLQRALWRDHSRRWRADNPARAREICREYYQRNRERILQHTREYKAARKAALKATEPDPTGATPSAN